MADPADAAWPQRDDAPRAADGVPRGQPVVDRLVALLDLERIEDNIFRGGSPTHSHVRVFGGQVAGQALIAAGRTVPVERRVHSLHAYFVRPGDLAGEHALGPGLRTLPDEPGRVDLLEVEHLEELIDRGLSGQRHTHVRSVTVAGSTSEPSW